MKIGLTYTGSDVKHESYLRWLKENEDIEIIKLSADDRNENAINECDALVLSGGVDIHPELYQGRLNYNESPPGGWRKDRDEFEKKMLESALEKKMPILGVCRGLQLINIFFGGSL